MRQVNFNGREKNREAIADYIRKSKHIRTEEELLNSFPPPPEIPKYITYLDIPLNMSRPPQTPPAQAPDNEIIVPQPIALQQPSPLPPSPPSPLVDFDEDSIEIVWPEETQGVGSENDTAMDDFLRQRADIDRETSTENPLFDSWEQVLHEPEFSSLVAPFGESQAVESEARGTHSLNSMLSYTAPVDGWQTSTIPQEATRELAEEIARRLGTNQQLRDVEATQLNTNFLRHCCEACIYQGQQKLSERQAAINCAVESFSAIIARQPDCSLTALNNMVFLLDLYGQKLLAQEILRCVDQVGSVRLPDNIISETIRFKLTIPKPDQTPEYDLLSLRRVVETCRTYAQAGPQLLLTSQFNLAWALLEMKQHNEALGILRDLHPECENVFGLHQAQTIMCVATLARAYLTKDPPNARTAEALINEVVTPRVQAAFAPSHPFYWEAKNRQALFKLKLAELNAHSESTEKYWEEGKALLIQVLLWRGTELGLSNPQTARTFDVLKCWLEKRGELHEAENIIAKISP